MLVSSSIPHKELCSLGLASSKLEINFVCVRLTVGQIFVISADTGLLDMPMILPCLNLNDICRLLNRLCLVAICS